MQIDPQRTIAFGGMVLGLAMVTAGAAILWPTLMPWNVAFWLGWGASFVFHWLMPLTAGQRGEKP